MVQVKSSSTRHVGCDRDRHRLVLHDDEDGWLYEYFDVPHDVYLRLMNAVSIGRFVNYAIKPHYHYNKIQSRHPWVEK
ncbi:KTSC domain-containing protein [Nitrospira sp. Nam74]